MTNLTTEQLKQAKTAAKAEVDQAVKPLEERMKTLETHVMALLKENEELKLKVAKLEQHECQKESSELEAAPLASRLMSSLFKLNDKPNVPQASVLDVVRMEESEIKKKEKNIVLFGVKTSTNASPDERAKYDRDEVNKIISEIGIKAEKIARIHRIRPKQQSSSESPTIAVSATSSSVSSSASASSTNTLATPIIVEFRSKDTVTQALKSSKKLRENVEYRSVYINPDYTQSQREFNKRLVALKKEKNDALSQDARHYFGIRDNQVVRIEKRNNESN
jgi:hypothetical protein